MAPTKFFVVVFICFLSYAEANKDCVSYDVKQAGVCGTKDTDLCITINNETTPVTAYSYSKEMEVTVVCHYKEVIQKNVKDFRLSWKKGEKDISNDKKCRNLKTVISLSAATNNSVYTCERHYTTYIDDMTANITFLYTIEDKAPLTVTVEKENGTSQKWEVAHESKYKVVVNEGSYYYFDGEEVNVKCGVKNSYRNDNFILRLTSFNSSKNILKKCSRHGNDIDKSIVEYKQNLTAAMTGLNYTCALLIGEKSTKQCVDVKQKYIFTLKFKLAKLRIYIDGRIREEEETVSGPEVVYKYEENVTIATKCSYDDKVYTSRGLTNTSHRPTWNTKKFYSTFTGESISSPNQNLVQIKLFLKHNNSYIDCVEQDSRIRLRFLYEKENLNERLQSFFASYWIFLTAGLILIVVILAVTFLALKSKKNPKEDKRRLNPKGSRDNLDDNLQSNPSDQNTTLSEPKLNEFYTELHADTASDEYCSPYVAMYSQAVPKSVRSPTVKPKPKPSPRNIENYSNIRGRVYDEPSTYNNIAKNTGTMYHNVAKNTGTQYHNVAKNTGTKYDNVAKNTGTMYHNVAKNTGATYNNINKNTKVAERVNLHDNTAASYYNTENGIHSSDVDSDTEFYEVPY